MIERRDVEIDYTNWKGERSLRRIRPTCLAWSFGNDWHPDPQFVLVALDLDKNQERTFAMSGIHSWRSLPATQET